MATDQHLTVVLTGGTGYIGAWVAHDLLQRGHTVRLTVRDPGRSDKVDPIRRLAEEQAGSLEVYQADLLEEGSFDEAADGADAVIHTASPFILDVTDAQKELVDPAVRGTRNVLEAATRSGSVRRVVVTSSAAAVYGDNADMADRGVSAFTEEHYNTSSSLRHQPYSYSKLQAEQEAWRVHGEQDQWSLAVLNPVMVIGPTLTDATRSESLRIMRDLISGRLKTGAPSLAFGFVDVRDVGRAHILALENPEFRERCILSERELRLIDVARLVENDFPGQFPVPRREAPKALLYLVGRAFGLTWPFIRRNVGHPIRFDSSRSRELLGLDYTPIDRTVREMVEQMRATGAG